MSTPSGSARELVLVTPDLFEGGGGIARIARATALACHLHCQNYGVRLAVLSLNGSGNVRDLRYLPAGSTLCGFGGNRRALAADLVSRAWRSNHAGTVFCHVNLSVIGLLFPPRRRFVVVAHGVDVWSHLGAARTIALRNATEVWSVSDYTGRVVQRLHAVEASKSRVIWNCLDPFWEGRASGSFPKRRFALAVSRLTSGDRYKGIDVAIRAFANVPAEPGSLEFWIAGDGNDRPRLEAVAASTTAGPRVRFLGQVTDEQLQALYEACEFFVLPSSKEGFGLVYLEAMAAGKAVVAASATAVPEVVLDGVTGRLLGPSDVQGITAAMVTLFESPSLARRYGEAGRSRAAEIFGFERYRIDVANALYKTFGIGRPAISGQKALHDASQGET